MAENKVEKKAEKPKELLKFSDFDSSEMVDISKSERAYKAMIGKGKPQSVEVDLLIKGKTEGKKDQELFEYIYKGMAGLIDPKKAKVNRENESKKAKKRKSR